MESLSPLSSWPNGVQATSNQPNSLSINRHSPRGEVKSIVRIAAVIAHTSEAMTEALTLESFAAEI